MTDNMPDEPYQIYRPETNPNGFRTISLTAYLAGIAQDMGGTLEDLANKEHDVSDFVFNHESMYALINEWRQQILITVQELLDARNARNEERVIYNAIRPIDSEAHELEKKWEEDD